MDAIQQHLLDTYRAARRAEATPPAPGLHTVRTAREIRQWQRFQAVVFGAEGRGSGLLRRAVRAAVPGFSRSRRATSALAPTVAEGRSPESSTRGGNDLLRA
ncbi:hypothetical protein ACGFOU_31520 [Streptomyces sp. NPDC048595]|uniref:hypothetical protein n=1 Tax=Streptomyces sp. NPDC048595 TaxID=3365576 RepID=UPI0037148106